MRFRNYSMALRQEGKENIQVTGALQRTSSAVVDTRTFKNSDERGREEGYFSFSGYYRMPGREC